MLLLYLNTITSPYERCQPQVLALNRTLTLGHSGILVFVRPLSTAVYGKIARPQTKLPCSVHAAEAFGEARMQAGGADAGRDAIAVRGQFGVVLLEHI